MEKVPDPRWWLLAVRANTFPFLVQMMEANNYLLFRLNPMIHILPNSAQTLLISPPISSHSKEETSLYSATKQEEAYISSWRSYLLLVKKSRYGPIASSVQGFRRLMPRSWLDLKSCLRLCWQSSVPCGERLRLLSTRVTCYSLLRDTLRNTVICFFKADWRTFAVPSPISGT